MFNWPIHSRVHGPVTYSSCVAATLRKGKSEECLKKKIPKRLGQERADQSPKLASAMWENNTKYQIPKKPNDNTNTNANKIATNNSATAF